MRIGRITGTVVVLVALAAGCGGDDGGGGSSDGGDASSQEAGVTLEEWAGQVDEICTEAHEAVEDLEIETTGDLRERGEEAVEIGEEALADIDELERPDGDDEERAADLVEALEERADLYQEVLDEVGEGDDELALLAVTVENVEVYEDGVEAAEEAGAGECQESFEENVEDTGRVADLFEQAGALSDVRVGDCLAGLEDGDLRPEPCGPGAEGEVRTTSVSGATCPTGQVSRGSDGITFCLELLVGPEDEDEHLDVGSCILLEDGEQDTVDITELPCGEEGVTHVIVLSVRRSQECGPDDRRFDKTPQEIARSGRGEWCAQPV